MAHHPAPTVVATAGAANANSYITRAEFELYLGTRLHVSNAVDNATNDTLDKAIIAATRLIDAVMCWTGDAASETQALAWPRTGMYSRNEVAIGSSTLPQQLKDAVSELALVLIDSNFTATNDALSQGISEVKAGPVAVKFTNTTTLNNDQFTSAQLLLPYHVVNLLVPSWICDDWVNAQTPPERDEYEFERFDTDTDVDTDE